RSPLMQMALLASDGSIHFVARSGFDSHAFSIQEYKAMFAASSRGLPNPVIPRPIPGEGWKVIETFASAAPFANGGPLPIIFRTRISSNAADDVMVFNPSIGQMAVLGHPDLPQDASTFVPGQISTRPYSGAAIHAISMKTNVDGRPGIVLLE